MEQNYHKDHLACKHCDKKLIACRYILKDENPYCIPCYQELFAHNCFECKKPIGPDYKDLSYKDKHWHEFCFKCCECQKSLVNQPFAHKDNEIFCSDCHDELFAARCDGCKKPFKGGMKKFEYKGTQWHEECFVCNVCKEPIKNKSFIPRGDEVVCIPCFENKYAQRCAKCNGVLTKGGVAYKDIPWHRECFTCSKCGKNLAGEKFTSRDDKPFCADCYGDMFAKKCCICTKPIMGVSTLDDGSVISQGLTDNEIGDFMPSNSIKLMFQVSVAPNLSPSKNAIGTVTASTVISANPAWLEKDS